MKNLIKSFLYITFAICCITSCNNNHQKEQQKEQRVKSWGEAKTEFISTLTASDTTNVKQMALKCMDLLKADSIDQALDMLYTVQENKLRKLTEEEKGQLSKRFKIFPVIDYKFESLTFSTQGNSDVKFTSYFAKSENVQNSLKTIKLMFNPIKIENQWYLSMKNIGQSSQDIVNHPTDNSVAPAEITF